MFERKTEVFSQSSPTSMPAIENCHYFHDYTVMSEHPYLKCQVEEATFCLLFENKLSVCNASPTLSTGTQHHLLASWGQHCNSLRVPKSVGIGQCPLPPTATNKSKREAVLQCGDQHSRSSLLTRLNSLHLPVWQPLQGSEEEKKLDLFFFFF